MRLVSGMAADVPHLGLKLPASPGAEQSVSRTAPGEGLNTTACLSVNHIDLPGRLGDRHASNGSTWVVNFAAPGSP